MEEKLQDAGPALNGELLREAKAMGFSDREIASLTGLPLETITRMREQEGIKPVFLKIDASSAFSQSTLPYYYSTFSPREEEWEPLPGPKVMVLGAGPIRIGQGIEFDYCAVHAAWALKRESISPIMINNNPETVSTDYDTADRLYFEPLTPESVLAILERERPEGVVVQFGGQTAINLARPIAEAGYRILGTPVEAIDRAEDRERFDELLRDLGIPRPQGGTATGVAQAVEIARSLGFPVLVRPSYVLGGRAMEIVYDEEELREYASRAVKVEPEHPILIDKYLPGKEVEVDGVSDGERILISGIMEQVERAGIHSGDSIALFPARDLSAEVIEKIVDYAERMARALGIQGLFNIQFVVQGTEVYVLELNPRASRTVPYISKVTGVPLVGLGIEVLLGKKLGQLGYGVGLLPPPPFSAVKVPVFSFSKLPRVDVTLGPEMKSTGEVLGLARSLPLALYKGLVAAGLRLRPRGVLLATIADRDKGEAIPIIRGFAHMGYRIWATAGTAGALAAAGIPPQGVKKIGEGSPHIVDFIREGGSGDKYCNPG